MTRSWLLPLAALLLLPCLPASAAPPSASEIKKALKSKDPAAVKGMLESLKGTLDKKSMTTILKSAPKLRELGVYKELVAALSTADGEALEVLAKAYGF